jgi:glucose-6-phosphate isomerase
MLEVVFVCKAMNVNPFDQPCVEFGKNIAKDIIRDIDSLLYKECP